MYLKQNDAEYLSDTLYYLEFVDFIRYRRSLPDEVLEKLLLQNMEIMYNKIIEELKKFVNINYC